MSIFDRAWCWYLIIYSGNGFCFRIITHIFPVLWDFMELYGTWIWTQLSFFSRGRKLSMRLINISMMIKDCRILCQVIFLIWLYNLEHKKETMHKQVRWSQQYHFVTHHKNPIWFKVSVNISKMECQIVVPFRFPFSRIANGHILFLSTQCTPLWKRQKFANVQCTLTLQDQCHISPIFR